MYMNGNRSKKAQISTQFAWIFILIAGAIILIFFLSLVYKQKDISETKLSATVLTYLDSILSGATLSSGTSQPIDTSFDLEMNFICDEDGFSRYEIADSSLGKDTPAEIIFAPDTIKGRRIIAWSLDFNAPFKVTNFLYLSDQDIKYVFVNPAGTFASDIIKRMPKDFTSETIISPAGVTNKGFHKIRLIFFQEDPATIQLPPHLQDKDLDISAVKISPTMVTFYRRTENRENFRQEGSLSYISYPSAFGAIFSQDYTFYECNMKKAMKKLSLIAKIHAEKQNSMKLYFESNPTPQECNRLYHTDTDDALPGLIIQAEQCSITPKNCINNIRDFNIREILDEQDALIRNSCPLLY